MSFKLKSSGLPFKELGSSPAKQVVAEADSSSVAKPITPKVLDDQSHLDQSTEFEKNYVEAEGFMRDREDMRKARKLDEARLKKGKKEDKQGAKDSVKKVAKPTEKKYMAVKKDLKPVEKKETDAERNKRLASNYETPAGAR